MPGKGWSKLFLSRIATTAKSYKPPTSLAFIVEFSFGTHTSTLKKIIKGQCTLRKEMKCSGDSEILH